MKTIAFQISTEDYLFLKRAAEDNGRSISEEVRHALKVYYSTDVVAPNAPEGRHPRITEDRVLSRPCI